MSVTLSKQNSKFMLALEKVLDKTVIELLEFEKAVISDSGSQWQIYFNSVCQLDDAQHLALEQAIKKIVPPEVEVELFVRVEAPTQALEAVTEVNGEKVYSATVKYRVIDFYNWDEAKTSGFLDGKGPSQYQLCQLHRAGKAQEFLTYGEISYEISWTQGQTIDQILA